MLSLQHIKKSYDGVPVLQDITLDIRDGEIVSILGPSGCGKTTLLNLILGITDAEEGKILFHEQDITHEPMEKRGFNIVFQDYALFPNLNVYQNITYGLRNKPGISSEEEVKELVHLLGLEEHLNKKIDQLSGGQKQRISIARAIMKDAPIVILDEATANVDPENEKELMDAVAALTKEKTIIMIAHRLKTVRHADRIVVVDKGRIVQQGTHEQLMQQEGIYRRFVDAREQAVSWKL